MVINQRRCLSCRQIAPKNAFWRIVRLYPSGQVQLDQGMGRSAYICPQESCLTKARQKNRLSRVLKAPVAAEIYQALQERLEQTVSMDSKKTLQSPPLKITMEKDTSRGIVDEQFKS